MSIFNKKEKDYAAQVSDPLSLPEEPRYSPKAETSANSEVSVLSTVGPTVRIKGELIGDEDLTIDGHVDGIIDVKRNLTLGAKGIVEAEVHAGSVIVQGRLVGNVIADKKVEIQPTGSVEGNIRAPKVMIAEGAHFKGNVDMSGAGDGDPSNPGGGKPGMPGKARIDSGRKGA